jgi:hypothetical protein
LCQMLFTKHLKEVHGLVVEKVKPKKLSIFEGSFRHQDHVKWMFAFWGMPWPCKGGMIKRFLIMLMPKLSPSEISW